jgi:hypothetical protein
VRCGNAVSLRADAELPTNSHVCSQCLAVFKDKSIAAPALKVRKQVEIARTRSRRERARLLLSLWSGLGHAYGGAPIRGGVLAFAFAVLVAAVSIRGAALRTPYDGDPTGLLAAPLGLVAVILWGTTLRSIVRRLS